jgi:hypothetical protein
LKIWRWVAPAAAAGSLAVAFAIPAQATSQPGYKITISAVGSAPGSVKGKVGGYALVVYHVAHQDTGTISGTISGAAAGDIVTLLAKPFGARSFGPAGQTATLSAAGTDSFRFSVRPTLATGYEAQVSTGTGVDATSASTTVFVTYSGRQTSSHERCNATTCAYSYTFHSFLPPSAYRTETRKRLYLYLAQWKSSHRAKWFYLSRAGSASKPRRIGAGAYAQTVTWHISLKAGRSWWTGLCSRDAENRDGIGLPGHHGCGNRRATWAQILGYMG